MKPAAIAANLVDVRNLDAHKCVKLTIHVPAEQAPLVLEAFGWPTAVDPVPVAIARLAPAKPASEPRNAPDRASEPKERRPFKSLGLPAQAAIRCEDPDFRRFLADRAFGPGSGVSVHSEDAAADVRQICGVTSRSKISDTDESGTKWRDLDRAFLEWKHAVNYESAAR